MAGRKTTILDSNREFLVELEEELDSSNYQAILINLRKLFETKEVRNYGKEKGSSLRDGGHQGRNLRRT